MVFAEGCDKKGVAVVRLTLSHKLFIWKDLSALTWVIGAFPRRS